MNSIDEILDCCLVSQKIDILSSDISINKYDNLRGEYTERHYPTIYNLPQFKVNMYNTINRFSRLYYKKDLQRGKIIYSKDKDGNHYLNHKKLKR